MTLDSDSGVIHLGESARVVSERDEEVPRSQFRNESPVRVEVRLCAQVLCRFPSAGRPSVVKKGTTLRPALLRHRFWTPSRVTVAEGAHIVFSRPCRDLQDHIDRDARTARTAIRRVSASGLRP